MLAEQPLPTSVDPLEKLARERRFLGGRRRLTDRVDELLDRGLLVRGQGFDFCDQGVRSHDESLLGSMLHQSFPGVRGSPLGHGGWPTPGGAGPCRRYGMLGSAGPALGRAAGGDTMRALAEFTVRVDDARALLREARAQYARHVGHLTSTA